jgi:hypothetical protein
LGSCQSSSSQHALSNVSYTDICILLSVTFVILRVVTCLIQPLLPNRQPHLHVAYPVSTDEALTPESQRDNCYISAEGNAGTQSVQRLLR